MRNTANISEVPHKILALRFYKSLGSLTSQVAMNYNFFVRYHHTFDKTDIGGDKLKRLVNF